MGSSSFVEMASPPSLLSQALPRDWLPEPSRAVLLQTVGPLFRTPGFPGHRVTEVEQKGPLRR